LSGFAGYFSDHLIPSIIILGLPLLIPVDLQTSLFFNLDDFNAICKFYFNETKEVFFFKN